MKNFCLISYLYSFSVFFYGMRREGTMTSLASWKFEVDTNTYMSTIHIMTEWNLELKIIVKK